MAVPAEIRTVPRLSIRLLMTVEPTARSVKKQTPKRASKKGC